MDHLPPELQRGYAHDFCLADAAFHTGRLVATAQNREALWKNWFTYVQPLGVDPYLVNTPFETRVRCLTCFAEWTQTGYYGQG